MVNTSVLILICKNYRFCGRSAGDRSDFKGQKDHQPKRRVGRAWDLIDVEFGRFGPIYPAGLGGRAKKARTAGCGAPAGPSYLV